MSERDLNACAMQITHHLSPTIKKNVNETYTNMFKRKIINKSQQILLSDPTCLLISFNTVSYNMRDPYCRSMEVNMINLFVTFVFYNHDNQTTILINIIYSLFYLWISIY